VTGSTSIAETVRRPTGVLASPIAITLIGLDPKARLLLLCARIGYTPHTSSKR
jgi:hypothetical protein